MLHAGIPVCVCCRCRRGMAGSLWTPLTCTLTCTAPALRLPLRRHVQSVQRDASACHQRRLSAVADCGTNAVTLTASEIPWKFDCNANLTTCRIYTMVSAGRQRAWRAWRTLPLACAHANWAPSPHRCCCRLPADAPLTPRRAMLLLRAAACSCGAPAARATSVCTPATATTASSASTQNSILKQASCGRLRVEMRRRHRRVPRRRPPRNPARPPPSAHLARCTSKPAACCSRRRRPFARPAAAQHVASRETSDERCNSMQPGQYPSGYHGLYLENIDRDWPLRARSSPSLRLLRWRRLLLLLLPLLLLLR